MTAQYEIVQTKKESEFVCSACGADRACDCNAPALEREAARRELHRQAQIKHRNKKRQQNQELRDITPETVTGRDGKQPARRESLEAADDDAETPWREVTACDCILEAWQTASPDDRALFVRSVYSEILEYMPPAEWALSGAIEDAN
jgi:hypothetical protein